MFIMKKNSLKKILISFVIIGIAFSVSACTSKTAENTNPVNVNNVINVNNLVGTATGTINNNSNPEDLGGLSGKTENSIDSKTTNQEANKIINKVNNTIMSPDKQEDLTKTYSQAILKTSLGNITVKFYAAESPITVNNFFNLAKAGFYNGTKFHRVIKDFMIQGGDPLSKESNTAVWGTGGPSYRFADEFNDHKLVRGSLAMANSGSDTNGSQFFIVTLDATPWLDGKHTNFGYVVGGMDVVKKIEAVQTGAYDRPVTDVVVNSVELVK